MRVGREDHAPACAGSAAPAIATEDAVVLYEVSDPDNPDWANGEVFYGYASVDGYTVAVLGMDGEEFEREFTEFFTHAVLKVRDR